MEKQDKTKKLICYITLLVLGLFILITPFLPVIEINKSKTIKNYNEDGVTDVAVSEEDGQTVNEGSLLLGDKKGVQVSLVDILLFLQHHYTDTQVNELAKKYYDNKEYSNSLKVYAIDAYLQLPYKSGYNAKFISNFFLSIGLSCLILIFGLIYFIIACCAFRKHGKVLIVFSIITCVLNVLLFICRIGTLSLMKVVTIDANIVWQSSFFVYLSLIVSIFCVVMTYFLRHYNKRIYATQPTI